MVHIVKKEYDRLKCMEEEFLSLYTKVQELEKYVDRRRELTVLSQDRNKARQLGVSLDEYRLNKPKRGRPRKVKDPKEVGEEK